MIAIIWLAFSIFVAAGLHPALPDSQRYRWLLAGGSFTSALVLLILFFLLRSRNKIGYYLTISFLLFLAILTVLDDIGLIDLIVLVITIFPIILLIHDRTWYLNQSTKNINQG